MNTKNAEISINENNPAHLVLLLAKAKGGIFRFPVYLSEKTKNLSLDVLDLSQRANNCLRRAPIASVDELINEIEGSETLKKLRGMGTKTAAGIMAKLFLYQYESLDDNRKLPYLQEVIEMNGL